MPTDPAISPIADLSIHLDCAINDDAWMDYFKDEYFKDIILKTIMFDGTDRQLLGSNQNLSISVLLTDAQEIKALNAEYRDRDKATNVLSFPLLENADPTDDTSPFILGDIALCFSVIEQEADEQSKDINHHIAHMLVHATLHLLGYDHEENDEAEKMEALEIKILKSFDIPSPYDTL